MTPHDPRFVFSMAIGAAWLLLGSWKVSLRAGLQVLACAVQVAPEVGPLVVVPASARKRSPRVCDAGDDGVELTTSSTAILAAVEHLNGTYYLPSYRPWWMWKPTQC